ncbi:MAG: peptidoglycan editing factor PgeF [Gammaproteobacteria bacterium]|nr:peptidoglycan editing factor PgeF [Gammaproteobacteria bacterium]MCF6364317.1 peptidoglycan editing factor PgeF [Gammaproteobacteria bacterium]
MPGLIPVDWPAPKNVRAATTSRIGGVSRAPFDSFNLADHVGDHPVAVLANRELLLEELALPAEPLWLKQVHGSRVISLDGLSTGLPEADASVSTEPGRVCAVLTADCLPVLFCDRAGTCVAAAHAGWRGLATGVLEATVAQMAVAADEIMAWLGPAIGPQAFEVGTDVRTAFIDDDAASATAFVAQGDDRWLADIVQLARRRLVRAGVTAVYGGDRCTYSEAGMFYSYRRDGATGRVASLVWLSNGE